MQREIRNLSTGTKRPPTIDESFAEKQRRGETAASPEIGFVSRARVGEHLLEAHHVALVGALAIGKSQQETRHYERNMLGDGQRAQLRPAARRIVRPIVRVGCGG